MERMKKERDGLGRTVYTWRGCDVVRHGGPAGWCAGGGRSHRVPSGRGWSALDPETGQWLRVCAACWKAGGWLEDLQRRLEEAER